MSHSRHKLFKARPPRWNVMTTTNTQMLNIYSEVAMVIIQEVLQWLPVVISGIEFL